MVTVQFMRQTLSMIDSVINLYVIVYLTVTLLPSHTHVEGIGGLGCLEKQRVSATMVWQVFYTKCVESVSWKH